MIGFAPEDGDRCRGARRRTVHQDVALSASAVQLAEIAVTAEAGAGNGEPRAG